MRPQPEHDGGSRVHHPQGNILTDEVHGFPATFTAKDAWRLSSQGVPTPSTTITTRMTSFFPSLVVSTMIIQSKYLLSATFPCRCLLQVQQGEQMGYFPLQPLPGISSEPFMEEPRDGLKI